MRVKMIISVITLICIAVSAAAMPVNAANDFKYEHDPRENPAAMADIIEDDKAIYGFRPNGSGSLKEYADSDWSDPELVEKGRQDRIAYHDSLKEMYSQLESMQRRGADIEEIARAMSKKRNELRLASCGDDEEALAQLKARNLATYGHEDGPTPGELYEKYGSWEKGLEKAFQTNSGMDACLGLYDDYYYLYVAAGQIPEAEDPYALTGSDYAMVISMITIGLICVIAAVSTGRIKKRSEV